MYNLCATYLRRLSYRLVCEGLHTTWFLIIVFSRQLKKVIIVPKEFADLASCFNLPNKKIHLNKITICMYGRRSKTHRAL